MYDAHHGAIRDYCFRRLAPSEANDVIAEVFLVVWRRIDDVPSGDGTLPYLYGIARNTVANSRRSARRRGRLDAKVSALAMHPAEGPEPQVVQREEARRILAALHHLNPTDQELLRLKAWEQLSNGEIAEVMGLTTRAVDTRLSRARKKLSRRTSRVRSARTAVARPIEEGGEG